MKKQVVLEIDRNKELMGLIVETNTTCYDPGHHMACEDSVCHWNHPDYSQSNPFCEAGYGSYWQEEGPAWESTAKLWTNWSWNHCDPSSYPLDQNFVTNMGLLGCAGKQKRADVLAAKEQNLMPGNMGPVPGNPLWQSKLMAKNTWLYCELNNNC